MSDKYAGSATASAEPDERRVQARGPLSRLALRTKLLLAVFGGAILPLALLGLWLARSAERSGQTLLAERLDESLERLTREMVPRWTSLRSDLLAVAASPEVQQALGSEVGEARARRTVRVVAYRAAGGEEMTFRAAGEGRDIRWSVVDAGTPPPNAATPGLIVRVPVHVTSTGERLGDVEAVVPATAVVPPGVAGAAGVGAVLAAFDPSTGASLLPLPFPSERLSDGNFIWEGERWLTRFLAVGEPSLVLALAAPLTPYTETFRAAARQGAVALLIVSVLGFLVVAALTRHLTRSLDKLAAAAGAVAAGELDQRAVVTSDDEIGAVAHAFNAMTQNLRRTLDQLSRQQGLATVGEFAAGMAHEVRNPLTAIRIGLQSLEEEITEPAHRIALERLLRQVQRLDATVTGSLRVARGGRIAQEPVDLRAPLQAAWQAAQPHFATTGGRLDPLSLPADPLLLRGDAPALEQVFLNLLLNAAQALGPNGCAEVVVRRQGGQVEIEIRDSGHGISPERLATIFEPLSSTRPEGTGLGLTIARRIAEAHGGTIEIESELGRGTTARVRLPSLVGPAAPATA